MARNNRTDDDDEADPIDYPRRSVLRAGSIASVAALGLSATGLGTSDDGDGGGDDITALVDELTLEEKLQLVQGEGFSEQVDGEQVATGYVQPIERLGIPSFEMIDGPAGVAPPPEREATAFPAPISQASTWNTDLLRRFGVALGAEAKSDRWDMDVMLAPGVNITRVPQGGRTFEYFGEDPHLTSRAAVEIIEGVQSEDVIATVKHYAVNNWEGNRHTVSANIDDRPLREIYLPAFRAAVEEAEVGSVMSAYNRVNGTYASEHHRLLTDILKEEWEFDGYVVSDWWATQSAAPSANAGLDLEMPGGGGFGDPYSGEYFGDDLRQAVEDGEVSEATIDEMVTRILATRARFGQLEGDRDPGAIDTPEHRALARQLATEGSVLLKNEAEVLPIDAGAIDSIAVVGRAADEATTGGGGSSQVVPSYAVSPLEGVRERVGDDASVEHVGADGDDAVVDIDEAAAAAEETDVALVFVDRPATEGDDQEHLDLPGNQAELIERVAGANDRTVVVLNTGAPTIMPWIDCVPSVLQSWFPGQEDGTATASLLFGDATPSGKLPITFAEREADYPATEESEYPGTDRGDGYPVADYTEGIFVGYRYFDEHDIEPLFPFGHGESYTEFEYSNLRVNPGRVDPDGTVNVVVHVENVGDREGAEVVQAYVEDREASVDRPPKELAGFEKVRLKPGQRRAVTIQIDADDLAFYDEDAGEWTLEPGPFAVRVGRSAGDIRLQECFEVAAKPPERDG
ncbi:glycoside hydrolase family 3 C-terminal domain-containing protein [Haloterrigena salinisoli]|uniref:beta-glucosidase family protein n=1 Tax=Haloterrigena salinisoli TaxID=3132747 RepID=UPI0030CEA08E